MDILKARKKARAKGGGKAKGGVLPGTAEPSETRDSDTAATLDAGEQRADSHDQALGQGGIQELDEAIAQIEGEQAEQLAAGGAEAQQIHQSVADFVAGFDGEAPDEEASYRHGFAREREVLDTLDRYLNFRLADEEYAIELPLVRETIKVPPVTEVPRNPAYVAGIVSLRGMILPVIDLRRRLGLRVDALTRTARIIIAELDGKPLGLLVDEVRNVVWIRPESIEPPPLVLPVKEAEFLVGVGRAPVLGSDEERVLILIRLDTIGRIEGGAAA